MADVGRTRSAADAAGLALDQLRPEALLARHRAIFERDIAWLQARKRDFVLASCPACGSDDGAPTFDKHDLTFIDCRHCRTIYMCPRPSERLMAEYYATAEHYRFWALYLFPQSEAVRREKIHLPMLRRIVDRCDRLGVKRGTLLEVGPGFGTFCQLAIERGAFERVLAVEPTPDLAEACRRRGIEVIEKPIEEIGDEVGEIDVLVAFEVIEHLFDPRAFLDRCSRHLRRDGLAVFTCPNGQGFDVTVLKSDSVAVDNEHVNLFNPGSFALLLERCGFGAVEVTTPGRLDAELVRAALMDGRLDPRGQSFLKQVLIDNWERMGAPFQRFLSENGLSSHMMAFARRRTTPK